MYYNTLIHPKLNGIIESLFLGWRRFVTVIEVFNGDAILVKLSRNKPLREAAQVDEEKYILLLGVRYQTWAGKIMGNSIKKNHIIDTWDISIRGIFES